MLRAQWTVRKSSREAVSQMKCSVKWDDCGVGKVISKLNEDSSKMQPGGKIENSEFIVIPRHSNIVMLNKISQSI